MSKARQNANISPAVGRNMVINGAMNVAQRSASVTGLGTTDGYFTVDRFALAGGNTAGRLTMSQTADGPNGISANCLKLDCTTADTSIAASEFLHIQQRFEGQNLQRIGKGVVGAKQITLSFYVKANAAFTFGCELFDNDNTRQITKLYNTTTDWVRHEITFPADVDDGSSPFDDDKSVSLYLLFWLHAGSNFTSGTLNTASWANVTNANRAAGIDSFFSSTNNNFFITGVQMEVGPVATDFEQEEISTTLSKCQRYFQLYPEETAVTGSCYNSDPDWYFPFVFPEMRAAPTVTFSDNPLLFCNNDNSDTTSVTSNSNIDNIKSIRLQAQSAAVGSAGQAGWLQMNAANSYFTLDAEL